MWLWLGLKLGLELGLELDVCGVNGKVGCSPAVVGDAMLYMYFYKIHEAFMDWRTWICVGDTASSLIVRRLGPKSIAVKHLYHTFTFPVELAKDQHKGRTDVEEETSCRQKVKT